MPNCNLCGEPMPEGEEMFKYHGFSGSCPKPPLPKPAIGAVVEYLLRDEATEFWLDLRVDRQPYGSIGPFNTSRERRRALDDLLEMTRAMGAQDIPNRPQ